MCAEAGNPAPTAQKSAQLGEANGAQKAVIRGVEAIVKALRQIQTGHHDETVK